MGHTFELVNAGEDFPPRAYTADGKNKIAGIVIVPEGRSSITKDAIASRPAWLILARDSEIEDFGGEDDEDEEEDKGYEDEVGEGEEDEDEEQE
ncbi:unnamed protein product [Discula destructiva]